MTPPAPVGRVAFVLGFTGLLPQVAAVALIAVDPHGAYDLLSMAAYAYASLILSFLGGMWWGFAMRREHRQGLLTGLAVVPSLLPLAIIPTAAIRWTWTLPLVLLGSAVLLTLLVDRHLVRTGDAPPNWMRLRVPLSIGLGALTIVAGLFSKR